MCISQYLNQLACRSKLKNVFTLYLLDNLEFALILCDKSIILNARSYNAQPEKGSKHDQKSRDVMLTQW